MRNSKVHSFNRNTTQPRVQRKFDIEAVRREINEFADRAYCEVEQLCVFVGVKLYVFE